MSITRKSDRLMLLVDDDAEWSKAAAERFAGYGFEVVTASTAEQALALARARRPRLVVADAVLAGEDGFSLCYALRRDPELSSLPVVLSLPWAMTETDRNFALRVGASAIIERTADPDSTLATLSAALVHRPAPASDEPSDRERLAHARSAIAQLERQIAVNAGLAQQVAASELRYRTLMEQANDAIAILSPEGVIVEANRRLCQLVGLGRDALVGRSLRELVTESREHDELRERESLPGAQSTPIMEVMRPDGSVVLMEFATTALQIEGQQVLLAVGRDMTEQIRASAQLMVSDRLASIGTLAAGVAHEINNPLTAVSGNLDLATHEIERLRGVYGASESLDELDAEIRDACEAADRVRTIVQDIRLFSRTDDELHEPVDVHRVIESSVRMAWSEIRHRSTLIKELSDVPRVMGNEARLGQVVLNLIVNAAQSITQGGPSTNRIKVRTRLDAETDRVVIEISDTGPGIPPPVLRKLFTPFFTTKGRGVGGGLGLVICQRILSSMGGAIMIKSEVGHGTLVSVSLPTSNAAQAAVRSPASAPAAQRRGRILIVDDEALVGSVIRRTFSEHDVQVETGAEKALDRIAGGEAFDVILCDLMMPAMSGMELYEAILRRSPESASRMVFFTGGATSARVRAFLDLVPNARVDKPIELSALRAVINTYLQ